ncbi:MAG: HNH endonuclease [Cenarchaeum symbiont of Oopsacas minuta]|nr:HNH endonuclease [Cenarchaeum symbiont of Oopsacas minuta]
MRYENYEKMFQNFYDNGHMDSTYKGVFLYALTDVGNYDCKDLVGKTWLNPEGDKIRVELDFIAIRFAKYYWDVFHANIRHIPKNMADNLNPELDNINIFKIIQTEIKNKNTVPNLHELSTPNMEEFRKSVINQSIRREVLKHILKDLDELYVRIPKKNHILIDKELIEFMKENMNNIRANIEIKIDAHLEPINPQLNQIQYHIDYPSPFYHYIEKHKKKYPSLFLIGVESEDSMKNYVKTVEKKILHDELSEDFISVWGLHSTVDNKQIWNQIQKKDIILFSKDGMCLSKGIVHSIIQNADIAKSLWSDTQEGTIRDLMILVNDVIPFRMNLKSSRIQLINPTMDDEYNFAIKQVQNDKVNYLSNAYNGINHALDNISEPHTDLLGEVPQDVRLRLEKGESIVRKGQKEFRNMVLRNYHYQCAVCGITEIDLLEASHILPVKHQNIAGMKDNGICLCVLHHKMFDGGYLYFDVNYNLILNNNIKSENLKNSCTILKINENSCDLLPSQKYLKLHRMNFGFEKNDPNGLV